MSEYTPTTETVRLDFQYSAFGIDLLGRGHDFDRWLASVKAEAWDEGVRAAFHESIEVGNNWCPVDLTNPYRQEES